MQIRPTNGRLPCRRAAIQKASELVSKLSGVLNWFLNSQASELVFELSYERPECCTGTLEGVEESHLVYCVPHIETS